MRWYEEYGITKPFYGDDAVCILHGDCREILPELPNNIQAEFLDPPFNVGKKYGENGDNRKDYYEWCEGWLALCFEKLLDTGSLYLMTIPRHLEKLYPMLGSRGVFVNEIHWRNVSASHSKRGFWNSYQPILFYGKTVDYFFNTYAQTREQMNRWTEWFSGAKGQMLDYWDDIPFVYAGSIRHKEAIMKPLTNEKAHPCQMPTELAARAIMFSSKEGDIILDPFLGSGTTAYCAKKLNRKCIGIEIEEKYCEIAAKRCSQSVMRLEV